MDLEGWEMVDYHDGSISDFEFKNIYFAKTIVIQYIKMI